MTVIDRRIPEPDSQFRLRPCKCGREDAAYLQVQMVAGTPWVVSCPGCGATTEPFGIRHEAQIFWNTNMAARPKNGRTNSSGKI